MPEALRKPSIESAVRTVTISGLDVSEWTILVQGAVAVQVYLRPFLDENALPGLADLAASDHGRLERIEQPRRQVEFAVSRLLRQYAAKSLPNAHTSISHCRSQIGVAAADSEALGLDVECRLPTSIESVCEAFGWPESVAANREEFLHRWTRWEAWCKYSGNSVLDTAKAADLPLESGALVNDGLLWFSQPVGEGYWSVVCRIAPASSGDSVWFH